MGAVTRVALCFPGQGSQAAGMAAAVPRRALQSLQQAGRAAGFDLEAALNGSDEELRDTRVAQPALLAVELALLASVPGGVEVAGVAGHSVGEYAAAVAAGALEAAEAMRLVVERGRLMAGMRSGTMSALIGLDLEVVEELCAEVAAETGGVVVVANVNAPGQLVVSGDDGAVSVVEERARARGCRRAVRLRVGGAFHSPLMRDAAEAFALVLDSALVSDATTPIVCNVDGAAVTAAEDIRARLRDQLVRPVLWTRCVERLVALGAGRLVEIGPGSVLTGLARRIAPETPSRSLATEQAMRELAGAAAVP